jgi:hypothetical protein
MPHTAMSAKTPAKIDAFTDIGSPPSPEFQREAHVPSRSRTVTKYHRAIWE